MNQHQWHIHVLKHTANIFPKTMVFIFILSGRIFESASTNPRFTNINISKTDMWHHLIEFSLGFLWLLMEFHIFLMVIGDLYLSSIELLYMSFEHFSTKILTFSLLISWLTFYFMVILLQPFLPVVTYKANAVFVNLVLKMLYAYTHNGYFYIYWILHDGIYNILSVLFLASIQTAPHIHSHPHQHNPQKPMLTTYMSFFIFLHFS